MTPNISFCEFFKYSFTPKNHSNILSNYVEDSESKKINKTIDFIFLVITVIIAQIPIVKSLNVIYKNILLITFLAIINILSEYIHWKFAVFVEKEKEMNNEAQN